MGIGVWQVILILVIVLIIFGAGKLPRVMGDVAKGIKNFKSGMKDEELAASTGADKPEEGDGESAKVIEAEAAETEKKEKEDAKG